MVDTVWTIITLHIIGREKMLERLKTNIACLIDGLPIEHLVYQGPEKYGIKMRKSGEIAKGAYISWIDDDDDIHDEYVSEIYNAITTTYPEVVTFGSYTPGCVPAWLRTNVTDNCITNSEGNTKTANHICCWRKDIATSAPWLPRNYGAEYVWYHLLNLAYTDLIETHIHKPLHIYNFDWNVTKCQNKESIRDSLSNGGDRILLYQHNDFRLLAGESTDHLYQADGKVVKEDPKNMRLLKEIKFKGLRR